MHYINSLYELLAFIKRQKHFRCNCLKQDVSVGPCLCDIQTPNPMHSPALNIPHITSFYHPDNEWSRKGERSHCTQGSHQLVHRYNMNQDIVGTRKSMNSPNQSPAIMTKQTLWKSPFQPQSHHAWAPLSALLHQPTIFSYFPLWNYPGSNLGCIIHFLCLLCFLSLPLLSFSFLNTAILVFIKVSLDQTKELRAFLVHGWPRIDPWEWYMFTWVLSGVIHLLSTEKSNPWGQHMWPPNQKKLF